MLFLDHSSPRPDMTSQDNWFLENPTLFSSSSRYSSPLHSHSQLQSPSYNGFNNPGFQTTGFQTTGFNHYQSPIQHRKRRMSMEENDHKRVRQNASSASETKDWPTFQLPQGGIIQQSPFGIIKSVKEGAKETTMIDNSISLQKFTRLMTPSSCPMIIASSPSAEVESYMMDGYRELNKSYHLHEEDIQNVNYSLYDQSNEDAHLDRDSEM